jgi:hypothetical protein
MKAKMKAVFGIMRQIFGSLSIRLESKGHEQAHDEGENEEGEKGGYHAKLQG